MKGALFVIVTLLVLETKLSSIRAENKPKVPCFFIFGDSLSDVGNNNNLNTKAKVNYPPYGVDFQGGIPTGRFSNGRNFVDKLTQLLGFEEFIPAHSTAKGKEILQGVNYASGSAGIRAETGQHLGERISLDQQIQNHKKTIANFPRKKLEKCLYSVYIGNNDYINNYFMPEHYNTSSLYNPDQFAQELVRQFTNQLKAIYNLGARKFVIGGIPLIGCIPASMSKHNTTECVKEMNQAVDLFNAKLVTLVDSFNEKLGGAKFAMIKFSLMQSLTRLVIGFTTNKPCCEVRSDYQCEPNSEPCAFRDLYEFMDGFHPTQVVNDLGALVSFSLPFPLLVHPMSISQLISSASS